LTFTYTQAKSDIIHTQILRYTYTIQYIHTQLDTVQHGFCHRLALTLCVGTVIDVCHTE